MVPLWLLGLHDPRLFVASFHFSLDAVVFTDNLISKLSACLICLSNLTCVIFPIYLSSVYWIELNWLEARGNLYSRPSTQTSAGSILPPSPILLGLFQEPRPQIEPTVFRTEVSLMSIDSAHAEPICTQPSGSLAQSRLLYCWQVRYLSALVPGGLATDIQPSPWFAWQEYLSNLSVFISLCPSIYLSQVQVLVCLATGP
jgi:hypothetical protein